MSGMKHIKNFATFSQALSAQNEQKKLQEKAGAQKKYADFFMSLLQKYDVSSPSELDAEKKKAFFNEVDKGWKQEESTSASTQQIEESVSTEELDESLIADLASFPIEERNGFLGAYHSAKKEGKTSFQFKEKVYEIKAKIPAAAAKVNETEK